MNDYAQVTFAFTPWSEAAADVMAALLAEHGYESFVNESDHMDAYVPERLFDEGALREVVDDFPMNVEIAWRKQFVEGRDWNSEWEKHYFRPIIIGGQVAVHSSFHTDVPAARYDITIDPRMAFGTGHHSTTSLVVSRLLAQPPAGLVVADVGTGTGILAILAAMQGASRVVAIEIDPPAYENAVENVALNGHKEIEVMLGDATLLESIEAVDLLMANINRNIILADMGRYCNALRTGGRMILSGFFTGDIEIIASAGEPLGLHLTATDSLHTDSGDWAVMELRKVS